MSRDAMPSSRWLHCSTLIVSSFVFINVASAEQIPAEPATKEPASQAIEEVVVTAQKRVERTVDLPASISSLSADQLQKANVVSAQDLSSVVSGIQISQQGSDLEPTIRGIGTALTGTGIDGNIAIYVDGIYQPSQVGDIFDFNNVTRVDVLKGPQGTLFGRNATGGAILITTADPSFKPAGNVSVGFGSFAARQLDGYVTGGITDKLAADLAIYDEEDAGYTKDIVSGAHLGARDDFSVRSKILFLPTDYLRFTATFTKSNVNDPQGVADEAYRGNTVAALPMFSGGLPIASQPGQTSLNNETKSSSLSESGALKSELGLGAVKLTSYTSYRTEDDKIRLDLDESASPLFQVGLREFAREQTFTQEIDLNGKDTSVVDWVAGLYYYYDNGNTQELFFGPSNIGSSDLRTNAYSGFGDATVKIFDKLSLIGGIRYSAEGRDINYQPAGLLPPSKADHYWHNTTIRAGLRYALNDRSNLYGTFSQGFKSGTFQLFNPTVPSVEPEKVDAYEIGYKVAEHGWSLSLASFLYKYSNLQVTTLNFANGTATLQNAAQSRIIGAEAEGGYRFDENFSIRGNVAWTHGRYLNFYNVSLDNPTGFGGNAAVLPPPTLHGQPMVRTPEATGSLTFLYTKEFPFGTLQFSANPSFSSKVYYTYDGRLAQGGYALLNLNASWQSPDDHWDVSIFGKNVTDTSYALFLLSTGLGDQIVYAAPATIGGRVSYRF